MLIDWFTVTAQLVNFLLLIGLLKRFLYRPILSTIEAREKRIADELADADAKRAEAQQQSEIYRQKNEQFDQLRSAKMNKVNAESAAEKNRLLALARQESDQLRSKLAQALQDEQRSLQGELRDRAQQEIFDMARQTLRDLADVSLEASMVTAFIGRLHELSAAEKANLQAAYKTSESPIMVHSAFDLPEPQRGQISEAINRIINGRISIEFLTAPELISGIEMKTNGQKIAWSIEDYLTTLTQRVNQLMSSRCAPAKESIKEPKKEPKKEQGSHDKHL